MRRDAHARRQALIAAAAASFAERGYGAPLEDVAGRAGVGRGTLYRNFKDRAALALAIFDGEIDRLEAIVAGSTDFRQAMSDLALASARGTALFARIAADLVADTENMAAFEALGARLAAALGPLAARACESGELRGDIDGHRLGLALRMVGGQIRNLADEATARRHLDDALAIVLDGIRPR